LESIAPHHWADLFDILNHLFGKTETRVKTEMDGLPLLLWSILIYAQSQYFHLCVPRWQLARHDSAVRITMNKDLHQLEVLGILLTI
jgi:hypothetical protein